MSKSLFLIFELVGTVVFSVSGAMTGLMKKMDIFGVIILGLTTAIGGGVIRDIILGITPPNTFNNPIYAMTATVTAIFIFMPKVRSLFGKRHSLWERPMLLMDSLGLGVFTVSGIRIAYSAQPDSSLFLCVFVGVITGVGGGILRDVLAGNTPHVFVKHFYACASLIGALVCITLWKPLGELYAMIIGAALIVTLRLLAAKYRWSLPKAK